MIKCAAIEIGEDEKEKSICFYRPHDYSSFDLLSNQAFYIQIAFWRAS